MSDVHNDAMERRVEAIARALCSLRVGDAGAKDVNDQPRWKWYVSDVEYLIAADPLTAEVERLRKERDEAQSLVTAWQDVFESIEAHLQDRIAMGDAAKPETYLSIIRSDVKSVVRSGMQIVNARWADNARHEAAHAETAALLAEAVRVIRRGREYLDVAGTKVWLADTDALLSRIQGAAKWSACPKCPGWNDDHYSYCPDYVPASAMKTDLPANSDKQLSPRPQLGGDEQGGASPTSSGCSNQTLGATTPAPVSHETSCVSAAIGEGEVPDWVKANCDSVMRFESQKLTEQLAAAQTEIERLNQAVSWALGYCEFRERQPGEGVYWWRKELAQRAGFGEPTPDPRDTLIDALVAALNRTSDLLSRNDAVHFTIKYQTEIQAREALSQAAKFREGGG